LVAVALGWASCAASPPPAPTLKPLPSALAKRFVIAVPEVDLRAPGSAILGRGLTHRLITVLARRGSFRFAERGRLDALLAERHLRQSELVAQPLLAKELGSLLEADLLLFASVDRLQAETRGQHGLMFNRREEHVELRLAARLVDARSGAVLENATGHAERTEEASTVRDRGPYQEYGSGVTEEASPALVDAVLEQALVDLANHLFESDAFRRLARSGNREALQTR